MSIFALNKQARYDYEILETIEAGIALLGPEVKSIRQNGISLKGSYVTIDGQSLALVNAHIPPYRFAAIAHRSDPERMRALLLHRAEINRLIGKLKTKGLTLLPLKVYLSKNRIKIELGIGRGKKMYEKRELIKKRSVEKEIRQALRKKV